MKSSLILLSLLSLSACGSIPNGTFDNRAACTMDGAKAYFLSLYGPVGVSAEISAKDAAVMCQPKAVLPAVAK